MRTDDGKRVREGGVDACVRMDCRVARVWNALGGTLSAGKAETGETGSLSETAAAEQVRGGSNKV